MRNFVKGFVQDDLREKARALRAKLTLERQRMAALVRTCLATMARAAEQRRRLRASARESSEARKRHGTLLCRAPGRDSQDG